MTHLIVPSACHGRRDVHVCAKVRLPQCETKATLRFCTLRPKTRDFSSLQLPSDVLSPSDVKAAIQVSVCVVKDLNEIYK